MKKIILSLLVLALVVSLFAAFAINNDQMAAHDTGTQLAKNEPPDPPGQGTAGSGAGAKGAGSGISGP